MEKERSKGPKSKGGSPLRHQAKTFSPELRQASNMGPQQVADCAEFRTEA